MRKILSILVLALFVAPASAQNYNATPGSGLVFGSKFVGSVNYPQWVLCDPTTPANCGKVQVGSSAAASDLALTVTDPTLQAIAAAALPIQKNGSPAAATGQTPGTAQTGTQVNQDMGLQAIGNTSVASCVSTYGTSPGSVSCPGVNAAITQLPAVVVMSHASTTALANNLSVKASAGSLSAYNCTGIAGGSAGYCIAYNGSSTPGTGALTGANVLDFCYFDTTPRGCSLSHIAPGAVPYSTGIQILVSSAASPFTYTTGTDTAAISADYQ